MGGVAQRAGERKRVKLFWSWFIIKEIVKV